MRKALAFIALSASFIAGSQLDQEATPEVPAVERFCPADWEQYNDAIEGHAVVYSCELNGVLVILKPDKTFDYAFVPGEPDFVYDPSAVPGWAE